jgi:pSer/pThr/pTyr-binding forkhead associated (FHA) protein
MFTHVILRAITGDLGHEDQILAEGRSYVFGRASDCAVRLNAANVSRHHCLLDVHSPFVSVRDLGSLNGTLVNGVDIGHRDPTILAEEEGEGRQETIDLTEGDVLRVGDNLFWIDFVHPSEDEGNENSPESDRNVPCEACC